LQNFFEEHLLEDGHSSWPKYVAGYDDSYAVSIYIYIYLYKHLLDISRKKSSVYGQELFKNVYNIIPSRINLQSDRSLSLITHQLTAATLSFNSPAVLTWNTQEHT